jgi:hypothetical protein
MSDDTLSPVASGTTKTITLTYKGGAKVISIAGDTPIVRVVPASKANLVPRVHVVTFPPNSAAPFVIVGEKGVVPAM